MKVKAIIFLAQSGVLLVEFLDCRTTVTADLYCKMLRNLIVAVQNKRCGMILSHEIFCFHENDSDIWEISQ